MNPAWPTPLEEQLLLACFAPEEAARAALDRCSRELAGTECGPAAMALLPLVYRRWPEVQNNVVHVGKGAYFTTWNRNREGMAELAGIAARFGEEGIRWMALKGAALAVRQYRDLGLRPMTDVDVLVRPADLERAIGVLSLTGYRAENGATSDAIVRQARVRHACQFFRGQDSNFDLHWRPVSRCYSPEVTRSFWEGAETVCFGGHSMLVPSASDQLFHVCVHGLQWDWTRKIRWIADALTILREPMDWERIRQLAEWAQMSFRLADALELLRERFGAPVPPDMSERLIRAAAGWERHECRLLLKPCPLGVYDSIAWHAYHFRRIRPFDDRWRRLSLAIACQQYLLAFLDAPSLRFLWLKLRPHLLLRLQRITRRGSVGSGAHL